MDLNRRSITERRFLFGVVSLLLTLTISATAEVTLNQVHSADFAINCIHKDEYVPGNLLVCEGDRLVSLNPVSNEKHIIVGYHSGYGEGEGTFAAFRGLYDVVHLDSSTEIVIDHGNECFRTVNRTTRQTEKLAGQCTTTGSADGTFQAARFHFPYRMTKLGNTLYVTGWQYSKIRVVDLDRKQVSTLTLAAFVKNPSGITRIPNDLNTLLITYEHGVAEHKIDTGATLVEGGTGAVGDAVNESLTAAFDSPRDIVALDRSRFLVADRDNGKVKLLDTDRNWLSLVVSANKVLTIDEIDGEIYIGYWYGTNRVVGKLINFHLPTTTMPAPTTAIASPITEPADTSINTRDPTTTSTTTTSTTTPMTGPADGSIVTNDPATTSTTTPMTGPADTSISTRDPTTTSTTTPMTGPADSSIVTNDPATTSTTTPMTGPADSSIKTSTTTATTILGPPKALETNTNTNTNSEIVKISVGTVVAGLVIISALIVILYFIKKKYSGTGGDSYRMPNTVHPRAEPYLQDPAQQNGKDENKVSGFRSGWNRGGCSTDDTDSHIYDRIDYDAMSLRRGTVNENAALKSRPNTEEYELPTINKQQLSAICVNNELYRLHGRQTADYNTYESPLNSDSHYAVPDEHPYAAARSPHDRPQRITSVPQEQAPEPPAYTEVLFQTSQNPPDYQP